MSNNIEFISKTKQSTKQVLDGLQKEFDDGEFDQIFCIAFKDPCNTSSIWVSGNWQNYAVAAQMFNTAFSEELQNG